MTEIEQKALALLQEVCEERRLIGGFEKYSREEHRSIEAVCRALEQKAALQEEFDQHKRDVSDAVEEANEHLGDCVKGNLSILAAQSILSRLILPKPDPIGDMVIKALGSREFHTEHGKLAWCNGYREALENLSARGFKIVEAE